MKPTQQLCSYLADLKFEDIPEHVVRRTEELFLDWYGSALAGRCTTPVVALEQFAKTMGPSQGPSQLLTSRETTSPLFAALVNGAASHVVEQDDLHNSSVFHPATVVFPPALAVAQAEKVSGKEFIAAVVVGYEMGIRAGEFLGLSHYKVFHMTGTVGTLAAAAAVGHLLKLDETQFLHAVGSAGTQAAGLWQFLQDAADSKQLHTAKASADGLLAAYTARDGMTGATQILEGEQGMAAGMLGDGDIQFLTGNLGQRWAITETSFKFHASCRHTHPAADALLKLVQEQSVKPENIERIRAYVYQAALDVLGKVTKPQTIHQSKFSMGFVLALIGRYGRAGVNDFTDEALADAQLLDLHGRVEMILDTEIDAAYPDKWMAAVEVETKDGQTLSARVEIPKGDPGNTLRRDELENKALMLAGFRGGANSAEMAGIISNVWNITQSGNAGDTFRLSERTANAA